MRIGLYLVERKKSINNQSKTDQNLFLFVFVLGQRIVYRYLMQSEYILVYLMCVCVAFFLSTFSSIDFVFFIYCMLYVCFCKLIPIGELFFLFYSTLPLSLSSVYIIKMPRIRKFHSMFDDWHEIQIKFSIPFFENSKSPSRTQIKVNLLTFNITYVNSCYSKLFNEHLTIDSIKRKTTTTTTKIKSNIYFFRLGTSILPKKIFYMINVMQHYFWW